MGQSKYELSRFEADGAFVDTLPILEPFTDLNGDYAANSPALKLDDKNLVLVSDEDSLFVGAALYHLKLWLFSLPANDYGATRVDRR